MAQSVIPAGYGFFTADTFMSNRGRDLLYDLLKKASNRDPDAFDMYIYNDYYGYALHDLIDKTMSTLHTKIKAKDFDNSYYLLEALTVFLDVETAWGNVDDGDRVKVMNKAYGGLLVALLNGLQSEDRLDKAHFPALECFLKKVVKQGEFMDDVDCDGKYQLLCKAIGERLFKNKSPEDRALEVAQRDEWLSKFSEEDRKAVEKDMEDDEDGHDEDESEPWYAGGEDVSSQITLSSRWAAYKKYLKDVPDVPMRGGDCWDLSKWSKEDKEEFLFDSLDD